MSQSDWIDIDGRDSNGDLVGGYGSCYNQGSYSNYGSSEHYVHYIPTKEEIRTSELQSRKMILETRRKELDTFNKYAAEYLEKYEKWVAHISDKEQEIADMELYIKKYFGGEE
jgi:hypothetical protein